MKKILFAIVLGFASVAANAQTIKDDPELHLAYCEAVHVLAYGIMQNRQNGVSPASLINRLEEQGSDMDFAKELGKALIIESYEKRRHYTDEAKKRAAEDFASRYYIYCITQ